MLSFIIKGSHTISPRRVLGQAKSSCIKGILTNLWFVISRHTLLIPTAVRAALEFSTAFHVVAALLWSRGTRRRRRNVRTRTWLFALRCCTNKKNIGILFTYKTTSTKIDQQKLFITTTTTTISRDGDRKKGQVFFNGCEIKGDRLHRRSLTN